jgi:hypothetical protein
MAKSPALRFVALVYLAATAHAATESAAAAPSPAEMATTLAHVSDLMTRGVAAYLNEAKSARSDREARALIRGDSHHHAEPVELRDVEEKAMAMAAQMLSNLHGLSEAAQKLATAVQTQQVSAATAKAQHVLASAKEERVTEDSWEGRAARLEKQVGGLRETNHELEEEKRSLISSVQSMLHDNKRAELHDELKSCHDQLAEQATTMKAMKVKSDEVEGTLRHDNEALMSTLESCQKSQAPGATPTLSVAEATKKDVVCETKLRELEQMYDANQEEQHQMASTVNLLTRENEDLKGKVSKTNAANCPACPSCVDLASATVDVAHMAETTKIDSYISQSEGELAELPHEAKRLVEATKPKAQKAVPAAPAANATHAKPAAPTAPPEPPIHISSSSIKLASSAMAGEGTIGKYLRGDAKPAPAATPAATPSTSGAATGNPSIEQALETIAKEPAAQVKEEEAMDDGDDLARKLLLQAEHNLKLASM